MNRSSLFWAWSALVIAGATAISACQAIANLGTRNADPLLNQGDCVLPTTGDAHFRFANLVPSTTNADVCIRTSGTTDWGRPVLRNSGTDAVCQAGFAYKSVTVPIGVTSGTLDFKAIPAGGPCTQAATSEVDGVSVDTTSIVSIVRVGGGSANAPEQLVAHAEDTSVNNSSNLYMRLINAIPGNSGINIGLADSSFVIASTQQVALPANIDTAGLPAPVAFGAVEPAAAKCLFGAQCAVDANGYFSTLNTPFPFLVVNQGSTKGVIAWNQPNGAFTETFYAIGDPQNQAFPVIGLVCNDFTADPNNKLGDSCSETALATISFDTFNVGLYGANAPAESARRPDLNKAIAAEDADFLCLLETAEAQTQTDFATALATAGYSYIYNPTADLSTQPTNPVNQKNVTPPLTLPNPPCVPGAGLPSTITPQQFTANYQAAYGCMLNHCNTETGQDSGQLQGTTSCIISSCASYFLPLVNDYADYGACYDCLLVNITSYLTYGVTNTTCTTDNRYPMANSGANPSMLVSRFPFAKKADGTDDVDVVWQPTTLYRRAVLSARVQIDPTNTSNTLDVYCAFNTSSLINSSLDYIGNYSTGTHYADQTTNGGVNGFRDEQNFQVERLVSYVKQRSANNPAVILGDWHASIENPIDPNAATHTIGSQSPEALQQLEAAFLHAHVAGWGYPCNYCASTGAEPGIDNPYNTTFASGVAGLDFVTPYLYGTVFSASSVTDEEITQTATYPDIVGWSAKDPTAVGGVSEYYARRIRILRPQ